MAKARSYCSDGALSPYEARPLAAFVTATERRRYNKTNRRSLELVVDPPIENIDSRMNNLLADLRFGARMLRKSPGFALTTIAVLALGIGANAAVFSVVEAVLLRSLPMRDPARVVMIWDKNPALGGSSGERLPTAYVNFLEWQRQATQFEAIAGFEEASLNLTNGSEPERIEGARASANVFALFGVKPAFGTTFESATTDPSKSRVAVLTDAFFRSHFGGEGNVLGQTLTLNDVAYPIVGLLPTDCHLPATRHGHNQASPNLW